MANNELKSSRSGIQVISRAAEILRALRETPTGMSLGQIAERVDLPRSTVQRIISALQDERLVIANSKGGGLRLGPEITAMAEAASYNIAEQCRIFLIELTEDTGETSDLSMLRGPSMIFLDQVPGTQRLRTVSSVGEVFPLSSTANGRACLSLMPEEEAKERVLGEWSRWDIKGDIDAFMDRLTAIRATGLAFDRDEHTRGISAIGFGFRDLAGDLLAISVPIPSTRFEEKREIVEAAILKTISHVKKMMEKA